MSVANKAVVKALRDWANQHSTDADRHLRTHAMLYAADRELEEAMEHVRDANTELMTVCAKRLEK